jgi:hypothetical protein
LLRIADSGMRCRRDWVALDVLAAPALGLHAEVMAQIAPVVSGHFSAAILHAEPDTLQETQLVQGHADGAALPWSENHSGVP